MNTKWSVRTDCKVSQNLDDPVSWLDGQTPLAYTHLPGISKISQFGQPTHGHSVTHRNRELMEKIKSRITV